jgi:hypothetical protein
MHLKSEKFNSSHPSSFPFPPADGRGLWPASVATSIHFLRRELDMEALTRKRVRLQRELQEAYGDWLRSSELSASYSAAPVDVSGCSDAAKANWFEYLAAKERLILAYAELPLAA